MGAIFSKPKAPKIQTAAPAIDNPVLEPESPVIGSDDDPTRKKGKKALRIDKDMTYVGSGKGINTPI